MKKSDYYYVEKNVEKIINGKSTGFLDPKAYWNICSKLKNVNYSVYYSYHYCDKVILYVNKIPKIRLLEILTRDKLSHREIMGSLYSLGIDSELFGDIIIDNDHYYIMIMDEIYTFIMNEFKMIGRYNIVLKEENITILNGYERKYEEIEFIVSSLRIDTIVSKLTGTNRDMVKKKFINDEIIVNYDICHKPVYNLKEGDVFSIRRYGKYRFLGVMKESKKGNFVIRCYKYSDN